MSECWTFAKDMNNVPEESQGELCYRGRHIMAGYMANPDLGEEHVAAIQKKSAEAIDKDGWLHSGDKGLRRCAHQKKMLLFIVNSMTEIR
jgi:long-subunit acyl-CoA synthetase (AMP-forming)